MKYKINKGFITRKMKNTLTIFDGENSRLITLNESASFIFECMKRGLMEKDINEALQKKYSIKLDTAKRDLKELIAQLKELAIISNN